jgi:transposase
MRPTRSRARSVAWRRATRPVTPPSAWPIRTTASPLNRVRHERPTYRVSLRDAMMSPFVSWRGFGVDGEGFEPVGERGARYGRRVEVISGVERRRRWSRDEKAQITSESFAPGASVSDVARRHNMSLGLLHHWRRAARDVAGEAPQTFVPILPTEELALYPAARLGGVVIEIEFCGASIRLRGGVDGTTLRTVLAAVRRA